MDEEEKDVTGEETPEETPGDTAEDTGEQTPGTAPEEHPEDATVALIADLNGKYDALAERVSMLTDLVATIQAATTDESSDDSDDDTYSVLDLDDFAKLNGGY